MQQSFFKKQRSASFYHMKYTEDDFEDATSAVYTWNANSPTIVSDLPTTVTDSPTTVTDSPTIVTDSPTIVTDL